jgi:protein-tyrosine phosphatase
MTHRDAEVTDIQEATRAFDNEDRLTFLVVCTANVCRSFMAEHLLKKRLEEQGLASRIEVVSAGTQVVRYPEESDLAVQSASRGALEVLARRGIFVERHRRRRVVPELLDQADLVLGMERMHFEEIVNLWPPARPKTFVLKEAARLAAQSAFETDALQERIKELDERRPDPMHALKLDRSIDVEDPIGGDPEFYEACASEILASLDTLLRHLVLP